jgi:hypothetical protein
MADEPDPKDQKLAVIAGEIADLRNEIEKLAASDKPLASVLYEKLKGIYVKLKADGYLMDEINRQVSAAQASRGATVTPNNAASLEEKIAGLEEKLQLLDEKVSFQRSAQASQKDIERVGVILVHGVGEQRRFEHLDGEARNLISALLENAKIKDDKVTVEIKSAGASTFLADQDTWKGGSTETVRIIVKRAEQREINLCLHEVWWGDVNEAYSLSKQFRFWLWGLAVWRYPEKAGSNLASADDVTPPYVPTGISMRIWVRIRLFGVGVVFALLGFSIGLISFLLKRLLELEPPDLLKTITNYVSGVKLYNQRRRFGPGLIPADDAFLDTINEPPRVSVRRRMIRTLAEVACNDYERWYILAHSLGTVVAFNGLMETAWAWPGYLEQEQWQKLLDHELAGPPKDVKLRKEVKSVPRRPAWVGDDIAYRSRIFRKFRGLVTYGSPLEKFATIWPARVPISRKPAFDSKAVWINVFDPLDPISGKLSAFSKQPPSFCPHPENVGYAASAILLLSHIRYLTAKSSGPDLATAVVRWLLGDAKAPGEDGNKLGTYQFAADGLTARLRSMGAWVTWFAVFLALAGLGGVVFPLFVKAGASAAHAVLVETNDLFRSKPITSK